MEFREAIAAALAAVPAWEGRFSADEVAAMLETPPNPDLGDFAFPCFKLAKTLRKAPPLIAQEAAAALDNHVRARSNHPQTQRSFPWEIQNRDVPLLDSFFASL